MVSLKTILALDFNLMVPLEELAYFLPDTRSCLKWEDDLSDPLKIDFTRVKEKNFINEEEKGYINIIKNTLKEKKIVGLVFGRGGIDSKVLIGNEVFSAADEVGFVNDQGKWEPICSGRSVILLEIGKEKGRFLISGKDEASNEFEVIWEDFFPF